MENDANIVRLNTLNSNSIKSPVLNLHKLPQEVKDEQVSIDKNSFQKLLSSSLFRIDKFSNFKVLVDLIIENQMELPIENLLIICKKSSENKLANSRQNGINNANSEIKSNLGLGDESKIYNISVSSDKHDKNISFGKIEQGILKKELDESDKSINQFLEVGNKESIFRKEPLYYNSLEKISLEDEIEKEFSSITYLDNSDISNNTDAYIECSYKLHLLNRIFYLLQNASLSAQEKQLLIPYVQDCMTKKDVKLTLKVVFMIRDESLFKKAFSYLKDRKAIAIKVILDELQRRDYSIFYYKVLKFLRKNSKEDKETEKILTGLYKNKSNIFYIEDYVIDNSSLYGLAIVHKLKNKSNQGEKQILNQKVIDLRKNSGVDLGKQDEINENETVAVKKNLIEKEDNLLLNNSKINIDNINLNHNKNQIDKESHCSYNSQPFVIPTGLYFNNSSLVINNLYKKFILSIHLILNRQSLQDMTLISLGNIKVLLENGDILIDIKDTKSRLISINEIIKRQKAKNKQVIHRDSKREDFKCVKNNLNSELKDNNIEYNSDLIEKSTDSLKNLRVALTEQGKAGLVKDADKIVCKPIKEKKIGFNDTSSCLDGIDGNLAITNSSQNTTSEKTDTIHQLLDVKIIFKVEKSNLFIYINDEEFHFFSDCIDRIEIGKSFDGILKKLMYAETTEILPFDINCDTAEGSKVITDIERKKKEDSDLINLLKNMNSYTNYNLIYHLDKVDIKLEEKAAFFDSSISFFNERDYFTKIVYPIHKLLKYKARKGIIIDSLSPLQLGNPSKQIYVSFNDILEIR